MFAERLGAQYRDACGETLVITGAVRVARRQPLNASEQSVHPTGIAIDLRKPRVTRCRTWLRSTLLELEGDGVIEATEEYSPPHFHVVVFPVDYTRHVARLTRRAAARTSRTSARRTYTVRRGDSLWGIAERYHTTVPRLKAANGLDGSTVRPGQVLVVPGLS
jgi:nucleoid-associated protein YgaU